MVVAPSQETWPQHLTLAVPSVVCIINNMVWKSLLTSVRGTVLGVHRRSLCWSGAVRAAAGSTHHQLHLGGVYPPMPTPFLKDESIAYDHLAANVATWNKTPFRGKW